MKCIREAPLFWCLIVSQLVASVASGATAECPRLSRDGLSSNLGHWTDDDIQANGKQASPEAKCGLPLFRLPNRIIPNNYRLMIRLDSKMGRFDGHVRIDVSVNKFNVSEGVAANKIVLHAGEDLSVHDARYFELDSCEKPSIRSLALADPSHLIDNKILSNSPTAAANLQFIKVLNICHDPHYQLIVLTLERDLRDESTGEIHLSFSSRFNASLSEGLFRSGLPAHSTIVTQFEPNYARKMFPCFDEPALKATFNLYLTCPANKTALSNNAPLFEIPYCLNLEDFKSATAHKPDTKLVVFRQSPLMSTYLLALTVGDYEFIEDFVQLRSKKLRVRIYTRPGVSSQCLFALQVAIRALQALHDRFDDDDFPLDKLDIVTVQSFSPNGMENWGLITMKESSFLLDSSAISSQKAKVAKVVMHELAHQWFGNLVTMKWWNDLWLNEGFTTWMGQKLLTELYPEFEDFLSRTQPREISLRHDKSTDAGITRPKMIEGLSFKHQFDYFAYERPATVIQMFEHFLGPEEFWSSIREFVIRNKFKSVELNDLLDNFRRTENLAALAEWLPPWLEQPGYPLIKLRLDENRLHYEQERFKVKNNLTHQEAAQLWPIPVEAVLFDGERRHKHFYLLDKKTGTIELPEWWISGDGVSNWIKIDPNAVGYYRVRCSKEMLCPSFESGAHGVKAERSSTGRCDRFRPRWDES